MANYDPAEVRAVLREHGIDVPDRGRLSGDAIAEYERLTNHPDGDEPGEYDAGVSAADFPADDDEPPPPEPERRPRRVRSSRPSGAGVMQRLRGAGAGKGKGRPKARRHSRVPVDRLASRLWESCGRVVKNVVPPAGLAMEWQAPAAGLILEDMVRDTMADRALQPIARAEDKAEKGFALAGLPIIISALAASQGLPDDQRLMRQAFLLPMLRECIIINIKIMGDKAEEIERRQADRQPLEDMADRLMQAWFAPPAGTVEEEPEPEMAGV